MKNKIKDIEKKYNIKVLYLSLYGSHLFGTADEYSDRDYKGVFIANKEDVILKKDLDFITDSSNQSGNKNSSEDVDFHLDSLHTWLHLLKKGETGAIDLLFSLWDESSTLYIDKEFLYSIQKNYLKLISKNPQAFVGYCISQTKKYNVRGERYNELIKLQNFLHVSFPNTNVKLGESTITQNIKEYLKEKEFKYINFVIADGPRSCGSIIQLEYLEVLGKKFAPTVSLGYLCEKLNAMEEAYGARARAARDNIDWKAMSHALRVILEVEELIENAFITFPLKRRELVYSVKKGKEDIKKIICLLEEKIQNIDELMLFTKLSEKQDEAFTKELLLKYYG